MTYPQCDNRLITSPCENDQLLIVKVFTHNVSVIYWYCVSCCVCCSVSQLNILKVFRCTLTNAFHRVRGWCVWSFLLYFLLSRLKGIHTPWSIHIAFRCRLLASRTHVVAVVKGGLPPPGLHEHLGAEQLLQGVNLADLEEHDTHVHLGLRDRRARNVSTEPRVPHVSPVDLWPPLLHRLVQGRGLHRRGGHPLEVPGVNMLSLQVLFQRLGLKGVVVSVRRFHVHEIPGQWVVRVRLPEATEVSTGWSRVNLFEPTFAR